MKKGIKLILALVAVILLVKLCSDHFGSVISLPGSSDGESSEESGGWFRQKEKTEEKTLDKTITSDDIKELERELGIGVDKDQSTTTKTTSATTSS